MSRLYDQEYYKKHREKILAYKKEYHKEHREEKQEYDKRYNREHAIERKKYNENYLAEHKEEIRNCQGKRKLEMPWLFHRKNAQQRCDNPNNISYDWYGGKGIRCLLTKEDVEILYLRDNARDMKRPSIDRINSDGHYCFKNCRFMEFSDNIAKSNRERVGICA